MLQQGEIRPGQSPIALVIYEGSTPASIFQPDEAEQSIGDTLTAARGMLQRTGREVASKP
jgi:hypothetical protein